MSERLRRIVENIRLRPDDRVLEIGCGHGVAATYICERLRSGRLTAIDRSAKMVAAATARNRAFVAEGKAEFLLGHLETIDLGDRQFDKILAVRVRIFHSDPQRARALAERWLKPGGRLFIYYDEPSPSDVGHQGATDRGRIAAS